MRSRERRKNQRPTAPYLGRLGEMTSVRPPAGLTLCLIAFICEGESALAQFGRWHKYASVPTTITSDRIPQDPRDLAPQPVPHGYTMSTDTDCGYPVCLTLQPRAAGACGIYGMALTLDPGFWCLLLTVHPSRCTLRPRRVQLDCNCGDVRPNARM